MTDINAIMQSELDSAEKAFNCNTDCVHRFGMLFIRRQVDKKILSIITRDGAVNRLGLDVNYQVTTPLLR